MVRLILDNIMITGVTKMLLQGAKFVAKKTNTEVDDKFIDFLDDPVKYCFKKK